MAILKSLFTMTLVLGSALAACNKTAANGIGSTPAQVSIAISYYR